MLELRWARPVVGTILCAWNEDGGEGWKISPFWSFPPLATLKLRQPPCGPAPAGEVCAFQQLWVRSSPRRSGGERAETPAPARIQRGAGSRHRQRPPRPRRRRSPAGPGAAPRCATAPGRAAGRGVPAGAAALTCAAGGSCSRGRRGRRGAAAGPGGRRGPGRRAPRCRSEPPSPCFH